MSELNNNICDCAVLRHASKYFDSNSWLPKNLARFLGNQELESKYLEACRKTAQSQMLLFNSDKNNYAHLNPEKSKGSIRFKATRQWVRVDSIQHVACFFLRLYFAEKNIEVL